jgi:hypothetical protein
LLDLVDADRDVVDDRPVPQVEMVHHPLIALVKEPVGEQPANVALHGADVAFGVVGDGLGGRVGSRPCLSVWLA